MVSVVQLGDSNICYLQETHITFFFFFYFSFKDTQRLKVKEWKNIFHAYVKQKKVGIVKLVLDKIDFKIKDIVRDKKGHYIMKRGSIQQENITLVTQEHQNI